MSKQSVVPRVWLLRRSENVSENSANVKARAATFAASAPDGSVLLTRRGEEGLRHYLIAPHTHGVDQAVQHLAHTIGARHEEVDGAAGRCSADVSPARPRLNRFAAAPVTAQLTALAARKPNLSMRKPLTLLRVATKRARLR